MNLEIERKFLVKSNDFKTDSYQSYSIKQGFLNSDEHRTVRIRITDKKGFITVKGKSNVAGTSRFEWEKEISTIEAEKLLLLCEPTIISKMRYLVRADKHLFEVDEFHDENAGLTIAEIELGHEDESFKKPAWLGKEVTGVISYYNSQLSKKPYIYWKK